ncbi:MAG: glycosyltransferase [Bryobacteraceae bacterium]
MSHRISDYEPVVGRQTLEELYVLADRVKGRGMQHINSTPVGGGVAEILTRLLPLLQDVGVAARWDVIKGDQAFYEVTKAFHNALHGQQGLVTAEMLDVFRANTQSNLRQMALGDDVVFVHDPQPAGLVEARSPASRWVWRCHIDVSTPDPLVWGFLKPLVERYDAAVFSMPDFAQHVAIPQYMVAPSIDPLSDKNRELEDAFIAKVLAKHGIDPGRPVVTQISRFDRLKDPLGVIAAYRMVRRRSDCQLVLAGGGADDDPEGELVLQEVRQQAEGDSDIHVLLLPPFSDLEINALVRGSTIILQKSIKEGFGLTVTEALWKRKPVIGGAVGGIRLQLIDGVTGFLVHSPEGAANCILRLLRDPEQRRVLGENGHEHVKQNFLITRHLKDYLLLMLGLDHLGEHVVQLG